MFLALRSYTVAAASLRHESLELLFLLTCLLTYLLTYTHGVLTYLLTYLLACLLTYLHSLTHGVSAAWRLHEGQELLLVLGL